MGSQETAQEAVQKRKREDDNDKQDTVSTSSRGSQSTAPMNGAWEKTGFIIKAELVIDGDMLDVDVPVWKQRREGTLGDQVPMTTQKVELAVHKGFKLVRCEKEPDDEEED